MKNIKVFLSDKFINYPKDYIKWELNEYLVESTIKDTKTEIDDYMQKVELEINNFNDDINKYKIKLERLIKNKSKNGNIIYIKGHPIKNWVRYGYNHYTVKVKNREFTLICTEDEFGADIPKDILEKIINNIYINLNTLRGEELINYYTDISINGYKFEYSSLYNRDDILTYIVINNIKLYNYLYNGVNMLYTKFGIPKKKNGFRVIESPNKDLKEAQRLIVELILKNIELPSCSKAFREGYSIIDNAKEHINKMYVLNIDLKDFFPSVKSARVYNIFISSGISHTDAVKYTKLCTFNGHLPQGAPSSPYISNIVCSNLDKRIKTICKVIDANYTRYSDDITISTNNKDIKKYMNSIENIIKEEGFEINCNKLRLLSKNSKQVVTGITVNEKLNVDKNYIRKIRQELYYCNKYGINQHLIYNNINLSEVEYINKLRGKIAFIKGINTELGKKLSKELQILIKNIDN